MPRRAIIVGIWQVEACPLYTSRPAGAARRYLIDLGRAVSLALSILSLYGMLEGAFFVPATRWEERLVISVARVGLAGCVCLASGLLFRHETEPASPLVRTLPVRLFLWTLFGCSILFAVSWYLDVYYMPQFWRNLPH